MTHSREGDAAERDRELVEALDEALASVHDRGAAPAPEDVDERWLGIGLRLGLERPGHARHLLALIAARAADAGPDEAASAGRTWDAAGARDTGPDPDDAAIIPAGPPPAGAGPADRATVADGTAPAHPGAAAPPPSLFLARSAAMSLADRAAQGPDVVFGWAGELGAGQVTQIGRAAIDMLAQGAPADLGRGFGLAWDGGLRIPRLERDALFGEFTELEVVVAGIIAGHDLRPAEPEARQRGFGAFAQLFGTRPSGQTAAATAIDGAGEPGRRALVALWNTWMAMRYRSGIPASTFDALVRPWVTVVGPLPDR